MTLMTNFCKKRNSAEDDKRQRTSVLQQFLYRMQLPTPAAYTLLDILFYPSHTRDEKAKKALNDRVGT